MCPISTEHRRWRGYIDSVKVSSFSFCCGRLQHKTTMHPSLMLLGIWFGLLTQTYTLPVKVSTKKKFDFRLNFLLSLSCFAIYVIMVHLYYRILQENMRENWGWKGNTQVGSWKSYFFMNVLSAFHNSTLQIDDIIGNTGRLLNLLFLFRWNYRSWWNECHGSNPGSQCQ